MFKPPATDNWQTDDFNSVFNLFDAELKRKVGLNDEGYRLQFFRKHFKRDRDPQESFPLV